MVKTRTVQGLYIPDIIPPEDRNVHLKKWSRGPQKVGFGERPALIVVDMCNSCVLGFVPGFSEPTIQCAKRIKKLVKHCRDLRIPVIFTTIISNFYANSPAVKGRWKFDDIPEKKAEFGKRVFKELSPKKTDIVIEKDKASAFFGTQLPSILTYLKIDTLLITGTSTSGCVRATVCDAFQYNYRVIVPEECVCDRSLISHKVSLFDIDAKYGDVLKLSEVMNQLSKIRPTAARSL